jgi:hypothetical protein
MDTSIDDFEEKLPGIQLAVFETLWHAIDTVQSIYCRSGSNTIDTYFQFDDNPSIEDRDDCVSLMQEVFDVAFEGQGITYSFTCETSAPDADYPYLVMSQPLFQKIAAEVAP